MTALAAAPPASYCEALRIAWAGISPAEVMRAHCAALDDMLADPAALASLSGRARLTALAETLRAAAARFGADVAPRGPQAIAPPARTDLPRACQRGEFLWTLEQESIQRPLVRQYGGETEHLLAALKQCCAGESWRVLSPQEVALAATNAGYDASHLAALAAALQASPLRHRLRTGAVLGILAEAQERLR